MSEEMSDAFQDKLVGDYFNEHFVSYKINAESEIGRQIAERNEVVAYPTSIFLDEELKILSRKQGSMTCICPKRKTMRTLLQSTL